MPTANPTALSEASEIAGSPTIDGVWLLTKASPWFSRYVSIGTVLEFLLLAALFAWRHLFPKPLNDTEALLNFSGTVYCAQTAGEFVFIASRERLTSRELTRELHRCETSALISFDHNYPNRTNVKFKFDSGECLTFHFHGDKKQMVKLATIANSHPEDHETKIAH